MIGLRWVRGLGTHARTVLEKALEHGPFDTFESIFRRCELSNATWLTLVGANAFREFVEGDRRRAAWYVLRHINNRQLSLDLRLKDEATVTLPPMSGLSSAAYDYENMGLTAGPHPMALYRKYLSGKHVSSRGLSAFRHGQWVQVAGVVIARQKPETAKGFCFISLEDEYGFINIIVTPQCYERHWRIIVGEKLLSVRGVLSARQDELNIKASEIRPLNLPCKVNLPKSYDFH